MKSRLVSLAGLIFLAACAAPQPPKQAKTSEVPDPVDTASSNEGSSSSSSQSSGSGSSGDVFGPPPSGAAKPAKGEAPQVGTLVPMLEGLKWGMSHAELTKAFTETGGVIWKDYDEKLTKARVGPEQTALEAEREQMKGAFARSHIEFKDTPTGYDATGIKNEYTYRNKEALMWIQRQGKKRYFFFINDRLWKIYDEVPLSDSGPLGKSFLDAVNTMNAKLGVQGRVQNVDPAKGIHQPTVDWKDGAQHLRLVDRSHEKVVGVVLEDANTLANLASLRSNKVADPTEIDPSIQAVTKGEGRVDPNAPTPGTTQTQPQKKTPGKKK